MYELICEVDNKEFSKVFYDTWTKDKFIKKCGFSKKIKILQEVKW